MSRSVIFYIAGQFTAYKVSPDVIIDEIQLLNEFISKNSNYPVKIYDMVDIEYKMNNNDIPSTLRGYKQWLLHESNKGSKLIIVRGTPTSDKVRYSTYYHNMNDSDI